MHGLGDHFYIFVTGSMVFYITPPCPTPRVILIIFIAETYVEFLRKRHHFAQSQGSALVPVHRSDADGSLVLRYETVNISKKAAKGATSPYGGRNSSFSWEASDDEEEAQQTYGPDDIDWGDGNYFLRPSFIYAVTDES